MLTSLEKLRQFFRLEHEKGYTDSAVIGGLVRILDFWEAEARQEGVKEEIIQAVVGRLRDYARLTPNSRAEALQGLWKRIQNEYPELVTPKKTPRPQKSTASKPQEERAPAATAVASPLPPPAVALEAPLTVLQGVGPRNAQLLARLGLRTLGDMLYYYPRRYEDYSKLKPIKNLWYGEQVTVIGVLKSVELRNVRQGLVLVEALLADASASLRLIWFNQPWLANRLKVGETIAVSGKVEQYLGRLVMNNPEWEPVEVEALHTGRIVPIYPLTEGISQKTLRNLMHQVATYWGPRLPDPLPPGVRREADLLELGQAIVQVHFPDSQEMLRAARQRLAFDEIFYLQMGVLRQKQDWQQVSARRFEVEDAWLEERLAALPFTLTAAQRRVLEEMRRDLASGHPMNRLLQGDVGSGKTVLAALAAAIITHHGSQAAIMAPTSILAEQHYHTFRRLLVAPGWLKEEQVRLLTGDTPASEKESIRQGLESGEVSIVIGTHALIEEAVRFADLQFAVIDEQHRFGVEQRAQLRAKGTTPHLLVMSATPIPRSLALTLYGDLDLSVLDEMPVGRQPVQTYLLRPKERERAYTLIRSQIEAGRQAFIIYPLIDESEALDAPAATAEYERLRTEVFPDLRLGLLHGRMRAEEKDQVMQRFRNGEYHILVSTTVVEVGVDVPNATVMLIEGANRFGLAQLHQLRGRVGRGSEQSFCLLIPERDDALENERLLAMVETNNGFVLAERDLQQRGPGEFLGTRQSGYVTSLRMASLSDLPLIEKARSFAQRIFEQDPYLQHPEHAPLAEALQRFWGNLRTDIS
ncbi:MAG: ATP-dependent DNA helicase RecG [Anaerolineales bacterium]